MIFLRQICSALNYLSLENISKSYGEKTLFKNLNLTIAKGQKIALVARNGSGKSTLLRVIAGIESPEGENAKIETRQDIRIGFLNQDPDFNDAHTILESVFHRTENPMIKAVRDYQEAMLFPDREKQMQDALQAMDDLKAWDFEARVKEMLSRFEIGAFEQLVGSLSGGQQKRLALVQLLIDEPDFLILDEPTNHLDLELIEWLEEYLKRSSLTLFMVTHDRYFLENICDHIVELDQGNLYRYRGNYSDFLEKKAVREENEAIELDKSKKLFKKELQWIRRMPQARTTKAKSRVDKFDTIKEKAHKTKLDDKIQIEVKGRRLGSKILEAQYISKSYGDKKLVDNFFYKFNRGEKVGIAGPNGVGKTTFLKLLTQQIRPDGGKLIVGGTIVFGYYTQAGINLKQDKRVIDVIRDIAEFLPLAKGQKLTAASLLERFLFSRKQQQVYVSQLSGGEKRRLYLLTVLMENPNFLILDEPTNDLDILTLNVLEEFLLEFDGCLLVVSHDRYFMDKIVDHLFVFEGNGKIKDYLGNYSDYRKDKKKKELEQQRADRDVRKQEEKATRAIEQKAKEAEGLSREDKKEVKRLERQIEKLEAEKEKITAQFNEPNLTPEKIEELSKSLGAVKEQIEEKEMRWMELADQA